MISTMKRNLALLILVDSLAPIPAFAAFDGPRVYWPLPKNTNILSTHMIRGAANASLTNWTHMLTTAEEDDGQSLEASLTKISFTWSWHDVLEKVRVFKGGE